MFTCPESYSKFNQCNMTTVTVTLISIKDAHIFEKYDFPRIGNPYTILVALSERNRKKKLISLKDVFLIFEEYSFEGY